MTRRRGRRLLRPLLRLERVRRRSLRRLSAALAVPVAVACAGAPPSPGSDPSRAPIPGAPIRVGSSGDYAPFSRVDAAGRWSGFDVELARAFARDEGLALSWARFRWPELSGSVAGGRFDVAMSGVTVRPDRSVRGRFSVPVAESGAVVLAQPSRAARGLAGLDAPDVRIGVNAGGHLERVTREAFPRAALVAFDANDAVPRALAAGAVDAVVTDTLEAPHWQRTLPGTVRLGPFTRDRKAYLWGVGARGPALRLDAWLLARESDGTLSALRERWLGAPGPETARPLPALLAAVAERLSLMAPVAEAKRASGRAVRDPAREARVLDAGFRAVAAEARALGLRPPARAAGEAFYRAQVEAAVAIQHAALAAPPPPETPPPFDLARELRPALLRLGDRIAWALVRIERVPEAGALRAAVGRELGAFGLGTSHRDALADALRLLAQDLVKARASSPASTGSTIDTP